ncbi:ACT domain-containing protein [Candidatus Albibeggiatoa sp. nov. NOAA]|uniref:glycine cleavage system protein R n=1 Tax=Candidatus Albibeggiatoa sp. nov. NOAA TaxID=3162724 RepID=UPI0032F47E51|nr:ACT domain-containing protein [Thiotrichaceae bacterium]
MSQWFMLTLVGKDQAGIVAQVTTALYEQGCNLGEASMLRIGGNFTMMLMIAFDGQSDALAERLQPLAEKLQLQLHFDPIEGELHHHQQSDVLLMVHGADRAGIVAQVTSKLADAGLNIVDLASDVGGNEDNPFYIMQIEGVATQGIERLEQALQELLQQQPDLKVTMKPIDTMVM